MAVDIISITALVISVIGSIGVFIKRTHLQHIVCCKCIESDCKNSNNNDNNDNQDIYLDTIIEKSITPKIRRKVPEGQLVPEGLEISEV